MCHYRLYKCLTYLLAVHQTKAYLIYMCISSRPFPRPWQGREKGSAGGGGSARGNKERRGARARFLAPPTPLAASPPAAGWCCCYPRRPSHWLTSAPLSGHPWISLGMLLSIPLNIHKDYNQGYKSSKSEVFTTAEMIQNYLMMMSLKGDRADPMCRLNV